MPTGREADRAAPARPAGAVCAAGPRLEADRQTGLSAVIGLKIIDLTPRTASSRAGEAHEVLAAP
jgi:hypothetical protein